MAAPDPRIPHRPLAARWPAAATWALSAGCLLAFDAELDLANKALVMVLAAACAAIWSGPWGALATSAVAMLAFNFVFVPPRGSFTVNLREHLLLLLTMLTVSWIVTLLVARLRWHAAQAEAHAQRAEQLRRLGDALRGSTSVPAQVGALREALAGVGGRSTAVWLGERASADAAADAMLGALSRDEAAGLRLCAHDGRAMGPGTGRHDEQSAWYLPLRGRDSTQGAALIRLGEGLDLPPPGTLAHAQALCDQFGTAREQSAATTAASEAREQAQVQALRNTLLTAISHDHRTPLATILGAAGALHDQAERLSAAQRRQLAATIVDEASQLARLTDNTLQLARLGAPGLVVQRDWESVEDIVGSVLRRVRQRTGQRTVKARLLPGLPLLRCDAVLLVQLLDNLVDNALKYAAEAEAPIEVLARPAGAQVVIAVRDRGPGVPPALRAQVFERFQRHGLPTGDARRGAGLGLALCRAIAEAHGGELRLRPRAHGGSSFELWLPVEPQPAPAGEGEPPQPLPPSMVEGLR